MVSILQDYIFSLKIEFIEILEFSLFIMNINNESLKFKNALKSKNKALTFGFTLELF